MSKPKFIATFLYTFFFGYLELKWRRLARSLSLVWFIISVVPFCILVMEITDTDDYALLGLFPSLIIILLISWVVEPFVVNKSPKIQQDNNISLSKKNWNLIGKILIILFGSYISYSFAVKNGTFPYFDFAWYIGFTISPMIFSFPIYVFKGRKNFWYLFYKASLYYWGLFIFGGSLIILFDSL